MKHRSFKAAFLGILAAMLLGMVGLTALAVARGGDAMLSLFALALWASLALWALSFAFARRLNQFAEELCRTLDAMLAGREPEPSEDSEELLARIQHRLNRLWSIQRAAEERVEAQRRELQALVSDVSHQVRAPMSNLRTLTDTLLTRDATEAERGEFLRSLREQTDQLGFLTDALVKTSRLETGMVALEKREARLYDTLAQAMGGIVYAAEAKGMTVTVECPEELRFPHDARWTAEALYNLLDNAVKYTPAGGSISVRAERWEMSVQIRVADTGRGIAPEDRARVFQRFYRAEDVRGMPGVGIGLYLAREIVERQGGTIQVSSQVGEGATFVVALPLG